MILYLKKILNLTSLNYYLEKYEICKNNFLIASTFLYPRFKKFSRFEDNESKNYISIIFNSATIQKKLCFYLVT